MAAATAGTPSEREWLEHAATCYLQGVRHGAGKKKVRDWFGHLPRPVFVSSSGNVISKAELEKAWINRMKNLKSPVNRALDLASRPC